MIRNIFFYHKSSTIFLHRQKFHNIRLFRHDEIYLLKFEKKILFRHDEINLLKFEKKFVLFKHDEINLLNFEKKLFCLEMMK